MKPENKERLTTAIIVAVAITVACTLSCGGSAEYIQWITEEVFGFLFNY